MVALVHADGGGLYPHVHAVILDYCCVSVK